MDYVDQYRKLRPTLESLGERVSQLLRDIATSADISVHAIETRAKTVESFSEKSARAGKSYKNPLKEITDLCGLRLILYYQEDVEKFVSAIRAEFEIDKRSVDKRSELRADQFGYISVHLICRVRSNRTRLLEWRKYKNVNIEIQVRTVLQHAWASISHALQYKHQSDIPDQFVRQLTRIAGLLELSDEQFSELRQKTSTLRSEVSRSLANDDLNVEINSVALSEFLETATVVARVSEIVKKAGLRMEDGMECEQLIGICHGLGISKLEQLSGTLESFIVYARDFYENFADLKEAGGMNSQQVRGDRDHWIAVATIAMHQNKTNTAFVTSTGIWASDYLEDVIAAARKSGV